MGKTWLGVGFIAMSLVASDLALAQQVKFTADADFVGNPSNCVESEVHVFVRGGSNPRANPAASKGQIEASVLEIDHCQERTLSDARGKVQLRGGALLFDGHDVTLDATVRMVDAVTKNAISVDFDLRWVGGELIVATNPAGITLPNRTLLLAEATGRVVSGGRVVVDGSADDAAIGTAGRRLSRR